jgi:hypothetical protein
MKARYVNKPKRPDTVIYCTKEETIIDYVREGETAQEAIKRLAEWGTALTPMPVADAVNRMEEAFRSEPEEITAEQWHYALNVLPPVAWRSTPNGESFKMSERTVHSITAIYVLMNDRYFSFHDSIFTPHDECCRKVFESCAYRCPETPPPAPSGPERAD